MFGYNIPMSDITPVVGYSTNDFFYNNPDYCPKNNDKTTNDACSANQYYASQVVQLNNQSQTTSAKYNYSLIMYNRELLRTVNYLAGVGLLCGYLYMNR